VNYAFIRDSNPTASKTANNSLDLGNNTNWTINRGACTNPNMPTLFSPANGAAADPGAQQLKATFSDPTGGQTGPIQFEICTVVVYGGDSCTETGGTVVDSGSSSSGIAIGAQGSWTSVVSLPPGTYYWHARATNTNPLTGPWSASWSFHVESLTLS